MEERAPNGFARVEDVITHDEMETISRSFHAAAGLDANTVNTRPSFVLPTFVATIRSADPRVQHDAVLAPVKAWPISGASPPGPGRSSRNVSN